MYVSKTRPGLISSAQTGDFGVVSSYVERQRSGDAVVARGGGKNGGAYGLDGLEHSGL